MPMSCGQSQSYWARFTSHHHLLITFTSKINTGHWVLPYGGSSWPSSCGILRCISFISESKACWVGSGKKQGEVEWNSKSDASPWWTGSWRSPCNELANWVHDGLENWVHNGLNNVAHNGLGASRRSSRRTIEIDENKGAKGQFELAHNWPIYGPKQVAPPDFDLNALDGLNIPSATTTSPWQSLKVIPTTTTLYNISLTSYEPQMMVITDTCGMVAQYSEAFKRTQTSGSGSTLGHSSSQTFNFEISIKDSAYWYTHPWFKPAMYHKFGHQT